MRSSVTANSSIFVNNRLNVVVELYYVEVIFIALDYNSVVNIICSRSNRWLLQGDKKQKIASTKSNVGIIKIMKLINQFHFLRTWKINITMTQLEVL